MTDVSYIEATLAAARPKAVAALLRYFRSLDAAEEAFQEASLRAVSNWPKNGPPRDPTAWLIFVGRNVGVDEVRKTSRLTALPADDLISDLGDREGEIVEQIDSADYRDDVLRLLFICCHADLPAAQQIAVALRIVSGLSVRQIARAFLVSESAMEQRITRAKAKITQAGVPFETPGAVERSERLAAVATMVYLVFNEGYSAGSKDDSMRSQLCDEAIRLGRLLLRMYQTEPEIMGLLALMLLQHSRTPSRFGADGEIVLLDHQDRSRWAKPMIAEGLALIDKAMRHRVPGPYLVQAAIAALHARADTAAATDWSEISLLYRTLERLQPSPVISLNRAVAVSKASGALEALKLVDPLEPQLSGYFHFHGVRGNLLMQLGRHADAREAFNHAIGLARNPQEAAHIRMHLDSMEGDARLRATSQAKDSTVEWT